MKNEVFDKYFIYNDDGSLTWKERDLKEYRRPKRGATFNKEKAGKIAGYLNPSGYLIVCIWENYLLHRLIYERFFGVIPNGMEIDHKNGVKTDNRLCNLRIATSAEQNRNKSIYKNNKSGFKNISWQKRREIWVGSLMKDGKFYIFYSKDIEEVKIWVLDKRKELHLEFARG